MYLTAHRLQTLFVSLLATFVLSFLTVISSPVQAQENNSSSGQKQSGENITFQRKVPSEGTKRTIKQTSKAKRMMKLDRRENPREGKKKDEGVFQSTRVTKETTISKQVVKILKANDERVQKIEVSFRKAYQEKSHPLPAKPEGIKDKELKKLKKEATPDKKRRQMPVSGKTYHVAYKEGNIKVTTPEGESVSDTEKAFVRTYFPVPGSLVTEENFLSQYLAGKTVSVGEKLTPPDWVKNQWAKELGGNVKVKKLEFTVKEKTTVDGFDCAVLEWKANNLQRQPAGREMHASLEGEVTVGINNTWLFDEYLKGPLKYSGFVRTRDKKSDDFTDIEFGGEGHMHNTRTVDWQVK